MWFFSSCFCYFLASGDFFSSVWFWYYSSPIFVLGRADLQQNPKTTCTWLIQRTLFKWIRIFRYFNQIYAVYGYFVICCCWFLLLREKRNSEELLLKFWADCVLWCDQLAQIMLKNHRKSVCHSPLLLLTLFQPGTMDNVAIAMHMSYKSPCKIENLDIYEKIKFLFGV